MTTPDNWQRSAQSFFDGRGRGTSKRPTLEELCWVSGRDLRLWCDPVQLEDLTQSILTQCHADSDAALLEVGCAAGFVARLLAPKVNAYVGVDVAVDALEAAKRLGLPNAQFQHTDGESLPFADASFDAAICYDVVTNFPSFEPIAKIIGQMVRVVRPGGSVLIGSVPDASRKDEYEKRVVDVQKELLERFGPPRMPDEPEVGFIGRLARVFSRTQKPSDAGAISCYYFNRSDFENVASQLGVELEIKDIHQRNPYFGCRFNAVFHTGR